MKAEERASFRSPEAEEQAEIISMYRMSGRKEGIMKEIFEQYGGVLITVVAVLAMVVLVTALVGSDERSVIGSAFQNIVTTFIQRADNGAALR